MIRSAPTVSGSSTSSVIGSGGARVDDERRADRQVALARRGERTASRAARPIRSRRRRRRPARSRAPRADREAARRIRRPCARRPVMMRQWPRSVSPVEEADRRLGVADVEDENHVDSSVEDERAGAIPADAIAPVGTSTSSAPSRVDPRDRRPRPAAMHRRPRGEVARARTRASSVVGRAARAPRRRCASAGTTARSTARRVAARRRGRRRRGSLAARRTLMPTPIATHSERAVAPARLDENAGELAAADVQIVRPLEADAAPRRTRRAPARAPSPTRSDKHVERAASRGRSMSVSQMPAPALGSPRRAHVVRARPSARRRGPACPAVAPCSPRARARRRASSRPRRTATTRGSAETRRELVAVDGRRTRSIRDRVDDDQSLSTRSRDDDAARRRRA